MRILVTGGSGYIGSMLVPRLLEQGYEVVVLDNFMFSQTSLLGLCHNPELRIITGDVRDEDTVWGVKYHELITGKPEAHIFIDDKAINTRDRLKEDAK